MPETWGFLHPIFDPQQISSELSEMAELCSSSVLTAAHNPRTVFLLSINWTMNKWSRVIPCANSFPWTTAWIILDQDLEPLPSMSCSKSCGWHGRVRHALWVKLASSFPALKQAMSGKENWNTENCWKLHNDTMCGLKWGIYGSLLSLRDIFQVICIRSFNLQHSPTESVPPWPSRPTRVALNPLG